MMMANIVSFQDGMIETAVADSSHDTIHNLTNIGWNRGMGAVCAGALNAAWTVRVKEQVQRDLTGCELNSNVDATIFVGLLMRLTGPIQDFWRYIFYLDTQCTEGLNTGFHAANTEMFFQTLIT